MKILLLADYLHALLEPSTAKALSAFHSMGETDILVAGSDVSAIAQQAASLQGVSRVLLAEAPHYRGMLAEEIAPLIASLANHYDYIAAPATTTGKDILPRAAALSNTPMLSNVTRIEQGGVFTHPIYAGNALETVQADAPRLFLTLRPTAFSPAPTGGNAVVQKIEALPPSGLATFEGLEAQQSVRPDVTAARVVVSGGRGIGSAEGFKKLEALADRLGGAVGASRAAVDAGYAPNDWQIGQTGKAVAPDLYLAFGISGAVQHLAGMKESRVVVAVNKDENAPIFEVADYSLVMDVHEALEALEKALP